MSDHASHQERLDFLRIDASVRAELNSFRPIIEKNVQGVLGKFYDHVKQRPALAALFPSAASIEHARGAQANHWLGMFEGKFDDAYVQRVRRIGKTHERIGLEPRWYVGGYAMAMCELMALAVNTYRKKPEKIIAVQQAMVKALLLDMDYSISIYIEEGKVTHKNQLDALAKDFEEQVLGLVEGVAKSVDDLNETASGLQEVAEESARQAETVAAASEETTRNVQTVASATEELSASIGEISNQVSESSRIVGGAVHQADDTNRKVQGLSEAAQKIGEVVKLINGIAGQTNLLALNATIEAARAGEAGKGFAVVASEVKQLATQTAKATDEIANQIRAIQEATASSAQAILGITQVIGRVNEISTAIASAVEEQGAATQEISRSIQEASAGTAEVSSNISGVNDAARRTGAASSRMAEATGALSRNGTALRHQVQEFLRKVRAG
jgi:methyl-accepting chemotaxis protein